MAGAPDVGDVAAKIRVDSDFRIDDEIEDVFLQLLGPLGGDWSVQVRGIPKTRWWEVSLEGHVLTLRLLVKQEEQNAHALRDRIVAALERHGLK